MCCSCISTLEEGAGRQHQRAEGLGDEVEAVRGFELTGRVTMDDVDLYRVLARAPICRGLLARRVDRAVAGLEPLSRQLHLLLKLGQRRDVDDLEAWIVGLHAADAGVGGDAVPDLAARIGRAVGP